MTSTNSDGVLHFKRKQMFSRKFFTFPLEDGALLISYLDSGRVNKVNAITKFNDFNSQDVFFGVSSNSSGDKLKIIEMKFREPEMEIKHIHTIDELTRVVVSDSSPFYIHQNEEKVQRLFRFDENAKKSEGRKIEMEFTGLKDFFVYKNFIYCLYHDSVSDTSTIDRYDMEHGRVENILKTEKTCLRNFLLDKHKERILILSDRTLLIIDHVSLQTESIESDFPYRPFYRLVTITEDGELTLSSKRGSTELWTATIESKTNSVKSKWIDDESSDEPSNDNHENRIRELERKFAALERDNEYEKQKKAMANYLNDIE